MRHRMIPISISALVNNKKSCTESSVQLLILTVWGRWEWEARFQLA